MVLRNGSPIGPPIGPPIGMRGFSGFCQSRRGVSGAGPEGRLLTPGPARGAVRAVAPLHRKPAGSRAADAAEPSAARSRRRRALAPRSRGGCPAPESPVPSAVLEPPRLCGRGKAGRDRKAALGYRHEFHYPVGGGGGSSPAGGSVLLFPWAFAFAPGPLGGLTHLPQKRRNYCGTILRNATACVFQYPPLNSESSIFLPVSGLSRTRFSPKYIPT